MEPSSHMAGRWQSVIPEHSELRADTPHQALTLLEFLVKNGSERVVDDARAHISTIKMLRSFHYIDEKGKDQGINGTWFTSVIVWIEYPCRVCCLASG